MNLKTKKACLASIAIAFVTMVISFVLEFIPETSLKGKAGMFVVHNSWVQLFLTSLALGCALLYLLNNAEKKAAPYYKAFTCSFLLTYIFYFHMTLISAVRMNNEEEALLHLFILTLLIGYSAILILSFARNQGKKVSLILGSVAVISELVIFFFIIIGGVSLSVVFSFISKLMIINVFYSLIELKYQDKDARGTI